MNRVDDKLSSLEALTGNTGHVQDLEKEWLLSEVPLLDVWEGVSAVWEFDGDDTAALADATGNGLTLAEAPTSVVTPVQGTGILGNSRAQDTTSFAFYEVINPVFDSASFTFILWIKPNSPGSIFAGSFDDTFADGGWYLQQFGDFTFFSWVEVPIQFKGSLSGVATRPDEWTMVAFRYDDVAKKITVTANDGSGSFGTWVEAADMTPQNGGRLNIGSAWDFSLAGTMEWDAARYFPRALSDREIKGHYNAGKALAYPEAAVLSVGGDHINDLWLQLFKDNGASSANWNDAAYQFLG